MPEQSFLEGGDHWETLVDFDEIAKAEGKPWVYGGSKPSPFSSDLFMLGLSDGGSDSTEYRLFSVSQKKFLDVVIPPGKHMFDWHMATSFFGGFGFADSAKTESGYPRDVEILNFDGSKKLIIPIKMEIFINRLLKAMKNMVRNGIS
jgi:prolyl oligopeptidase